MQSQQGPARGAALARVPRPEFLLAGVLAVVTALVALAPQAPIAVNGGAGWDGWNYLAMVDPKLDPGEPSPPWACPPGHCQPRQGC